MSVIKENPERMRTKHRFREPATIFQPDEMACVSAVTTQVLYMTGKISSPDVDSVDKALGRNPNQPAKSNDAHLLLLQAGLTTHAVCAFDEKRFVIEGLSYLQTYYGHQWTDEHDITFPLAEIEKNQQECTRYLETLDRYTDLHTREDRTPTMDDITTLVKEKKIVDISVGDTGPICHAVLIYDVTTDDRYRVYNPDTTEYGLRIVSKGELASCFLPKEGIVAIGT